MHFRSSTLPSPSFPFSFLFSISCSFSLIFFFFSSFPSPSSTTLSFSFSSSPLGPQCKEPVSDDSLVSPSAALIDAIAKISVKCKACNIVVYRSLFFHSVFLSFCLPPLLPPPFLFLLFLVFCFSLFVSFLSLHLDVYASW